ncbi:MAG: hypothetical protein U1D31_00500 [Patescibacteria group bacterium]|nr:hypothetical protein [bacterium]MDZ4240601.1 hypothetical protein [Patescibacteria group bacterium]
MILNVLNRFLIWWRGYPFRFRLDKEKDDLVSQHLFLQREVAHAIISFAFNLRPLHEDRKAMEKLVSFMKEHENELRSYLSPYSRYLNFKPLIDNERFQSALLLSGKGRKVSVTFLNKETLAPCAILEA